jgi:hypothetical protein
MARMSGSKSGGKRPGDARKRSGTGVAFSASVTGPFNDVLGEPLLACGDDPTVFRDDDGQAYFCGNCNGPLCAKLAPNMTALATALVPRPVALAVHMMNVVASSAQVLHAYAHVPASHVPRCVRWAQDRGLAISRAAHARHHASGDNFALVTGW